MSDLCPRCNQPFIKKQFHKTFSILGYFYIHQQGKMSFGKSQFGFKDAIPGKKCFVKHVVR